MPPSIWSLPIRRNRAFPVALGDARRKIRYREGLPRAECRIRFPPVSVFNVGVYNPRSADSVWAASSSGGSSMPNRWWGCRRLSTARPCSAAQMDLAISSGDG